VSRSRDEDQQLESSRRRPLAPGARPHDLRRLRAPLRAGRPGRYTCSPGRGPAERGPLGMVSRSSTTGRRPRRSRLAATRPAGVAELTPPPGSSRRERKPDQPRCSSRRGCPRSGAASAEHHWQLCGEYLAHRLSTSVWRDLNSRPLDPSTSAACLRTSTNVQFSLKIRILHLGVFRWTDPNGGQNGGQTHSQTK
jgi:hypothetical protein